MTHILTFMLIPNSCQLNQSELTELNFSSFSPTILTSSQSVGGIMDALGALTPFPSATAVTVIHSGSKLHPAVQQQYQQCEDNLSTDSSSISDESKKRKRRFFPFSGKKSGKAKVKSS